MGSLIQFLNYTLQEHIGSEHTLGADISIEFTQYHAVPISSQQILLQCYRYHVFAYINAFDNLIRKVYMRICDLGRTLDLGNEDFVFYRQGRTFYRLLLYPPFTPPYNFAAMRCNSAVIPAANRTSDLSG